MVRKLVTLEEDFYLRIESFHGLSANVDSSKLVIVESILARNHSTVSNQSLTTCLRSRTAPTKKLHGLYQLAAMEIILGKGEILHKTRILIGLMLNLRCIDEEAFEVPVINSYVQLQPLSKYHKVYVGNDEYYS